MERESEHPLAQAIVHYSQHKGAANVRAEQFENVPGHEAIAIVDGRRVVVGSLRLMAREAIDLGTLTSRRDELAAGGRTAVGGRGRAR